MKYQATPAADRLITPAQFTQLITILTPWRDARTTTATTLAAQTAQTAHSATCLTATLRVLSHFIQVLNLAIDRGTVPASARAYYELPVQYTPVPDINTPADALQWASKLAAGEAQRVLAGGPAMAWPTIGEVAAAATALQAAETAQSAAKDTYDLAQEAVALQRPAVDACIRDLWDTIEFNLRPDDATSLRRRTRE